MQYVYPEHNSAARLIRYPFPKNESGWPAAESSKVFILGAVDAVGATLCGDDWSGNELTVVHWPESPIVTLQRSRQSKPRGIAIDRNPRLPKTDAELRAEDEVAEKRHAAWLENGLAEARLLRAVNWLAQRCRDGDLKPYARPATGGEVMPMQVSEWNIDDPLRQFVIKGGSRRRFITGGYATPEMESYVFFDRTELQEVLARELGAHQHVDLADLSQLSPYLRLAVHIALKRKYFAGAVIDAAPVREAEVEAAWGTFLPDVPMTPAGVKQIAKLMGFPDPKRSSKGSEAGKEVKRLEPLESRIPAAFAGGVNPSRGHLEAFA